MSRKFILFGESPKSKEKSVAIHIDFAELTHKQCERHSVDDDTLLTWRLGVLSFDDPANDDFELWSPSEEREETCLFGRQVRDVSTFVAQTNSLRTDLVPSPREGS